LNEKEIFIFVNRRSNDKNLINKIKSFQKDEATTYFKKLNLKKETQMVYKDFKNIKPHKSMETLKTLLGLSSDLYSSFDSFHSDVSGPMLGKIQEKKNSVMPKARKSISNPKEGKSNCRLY